jgi:hypothetical protein
MCCEFKFEFGVHSNLNLVQSEIYYLLIYYGPQWAYLVKNGPQTGLMTWQDSCHVKYTSPNDMAIADMATKKHDGLFRHHCLFLLLPTRLSMTIQKINR